MQSLLGRKERSQSDLVLLRGWDRATNLAWRGAKALTAGGFIHLMTELSVLCDTKVTFHGTVICLLLYKNTKDSQKPCSVSHAILISVGNTEGREGVTEEEVARTGCAAAGHRVKARQGPAQSCQLPAPLSPRGTTTRHAHLQTALFWLDSSHHIRNICKPPLRKQTSKLY